MVTEVCAKLRQVSQGFRKLSGTCLTASSICEVPLGARTEVKGPDGSKAPFRYYEKAGAAEEEEFSADGLSKAGIIIWYTIHHGVP